MEFVLREIFWKYLKWIFLNKSIIYRPLEQIRDNYPKYVATTDILLQKRNGINHINLVDFMKNGSMF